MINSDTTDARIETGSSMPCCRNKGNDIVTGITSSHTSGFMNMVSLTGIYLFITTHDGNGRVTGIAIDLGAPADTPVGIFMVASASIETGFRNDKVIRRATLNGAPLNGFEGPGMVGLGAGNDIMKGFGGITAKCGFDKDTWNPSACNRSDFAIVRSGSTAASFTKAGITTTMDGFETFVFADGFFSHTHPV